MALVPETPEEDLGKVYDSRLMARLLGYLKPYRWMAVGAVGLILLSSVLQLIGPLATAVALDLYIQPEATGSREVSSVSLWVERAVEGLDLRLDRISGIRLMAVIYLVALVLTFGVLYVQGVLMQFMGQAIMRDLRRELFAQLQRLPLGYFDRNPIGRLVTRVTNDVDALNELFTAGLVSIFGDVMLLVGIVGVLFWLNWKLALVSFAILPVLLVVTLWFKIRARQSYREVRLALARINAFLQEHITGMSVLQVLAREEQAYDELVAVNDEHRSANVRAIFYYAVYYPAVELVTAVGLGLIIWYGGGEALRGALSIGALVAFLEYARRFYQPLADLSEKYNILQSAMASSERIFSLLDTQVAIRSPSDAHSPREFRGEIAFRDVHFSYKEGEPVLGGISFHVNPGETLAVVGATGAGKSTLANLLLRFYDVDRGSVSVDGVDVRRWDLDVLRGHIGLVLQDVFLFAGSVARNIRLGDARIGDAELQTAAREVHAMEFVERLEAGFDTEVRERGAGLSVGQKQLIAFARALAFDPRILILDEATSSIDTETEQLIQLALERLLAQRTSIVIAHRLSTIQRADRILVLHRGTIREEGTHQELLALRGIYYRLYLLQYKEQLHTREPGLDAGPPAPGNEARLLVSDSAGELLADS